MVGLTYEEKLGFGLHLHKNVIKNLPCRFANKQFPTKCLHKEGFCSIFTRRMSIRARTGNINFKIKQNKARAILLFFLLHFPQRENAGFGK